MPVSPFDQDNYARLRLLALQQAGGAYPNPSVQSDAMTALYLIATLIERIAQLEDRLAKAEG